MSCNAILTNKEHQCHLKPDLCQFKTYVVVHFQVVFVLCDYPTRKQMSGGRGWVNVMGLQSPIQERGAVSSKIGSTWPKMRVISEIF